ncbi:MAG: hypothetical protein WDN31_14095 [Hyphomicrobium sp.]
MIHPTEFFDTASLRSMSIALEAAIGTVRLGGGEPDDRAKLAMARRLLAAAAAGERAFLSLTEAALGWGFAEDRP